jgi:hypothetical protein
VPPAFARFLGLASSAVTGFPGHTFRGQRTYHLCWSGNCLVSLPLRTSQRLAEKFPGNHVSVVIGVFD